MGTFDAVSVSTGRYYRFFAQMSSQFYKKMQKKVIFSEFDEETA